MKRVLLLVPAMLLALGGCGDSGKQENPREMLSAAPDAKPGLSVEGGVLVLPAVKGNPGVAYFALSNASDQPASLAAIAIEGAGKAEMHETKGGSMAQLAWVQVGPGETVKFERGGKHVMVFDLGDAVKAGGTAEMTLTFAGGDKLSTPLKIEAVGGAT
jgi:copper(I)-binding protein